MIYDTSGHRKYLTIKEREVFIKATQRLPTEAHSFCLMLAYTGARISEVLALTPECIDIEAGVVIIESLKKRRRGVFRAVPIPRHFLQCLEVTHRITTSQADAALRTRRLWPWSRTTAWALVKRTMFSVGIAPSQAMPKALRHAFGVGAIQRKIPLNVIQKWLGHSRITTTAIYADAVGDEERRLAESMWL